jgi:uncharacterized protein YlxW (UPF0749 family)
MRSRYAQVSLIAVLAFIGVMMVAQLRSQARPAELGTLTTQELSEVIDRLTTRNRDLRTQVADLQEQLRDYTAAAGEGQSVDLTRETLATIKAFAGTLPVAGEGVLVTLTGSLDAKAVNDIINELRNAGAGAIAIDDVRVTARTVAIMGDRAIEVDGTELGVSVSIGAIGDPDDLYVAMTRSGGLLSQLQQVINVRYSVREVDDLELPATEIDLQPHVAVRAE